MKILLDTNFLLVPGQFRADIYSQLRGHTLFTLDVCVRELLKLVKGKGVARKHAIVALALVKTKRLKVVTTGKSGGADRIIISYAVANKCVVATNDRVLIKALKNKGVKVIRLRQKKLITEG